MVWDSGFESYPYGRGACRRVYPHGRRVVSPAERPARMVDPREPGEDLRFEVWGLGLRVYGLWFMVYGLGLGVQGPWFVRGWGVWVTACGAVVTPETPGASYETWFRVPRFVFVFEAHRLLYHSA